MNEIDYYRMQEDAAIGQAIAENLQAILNAFDAEDVADLQRRVYKQTECGAWLSVLLHDGQWRHTGNLEGIANNNVRALRLGSIVEGSDAEVAADIIDLYDYMDEDDLDQVVADFDTAIDWVEEQVDALWREANEGDAE